MSQVQVRWMGRILKHSRHLTTQERCIITEFKILCNAKYTSIQFWFNYIEWLWLTWGVHVCFFSRHFHIIKCHAGYIRAFRWCECCLQDYSQEINSHAGKSKCHSSRSFLTDASKSYKQTVYIMNVYYKGSMKEINLKKNSNKRLILYRRKLP